MKPLVNTSLAALKKINKWLSSALNYTGKQVITGYHSAINK
jgi:hypothetical protein